MITIRNSIKAIIIEDNAMLFMEGQDQDTGEIYYILPGGGQNGGETFVETAKRECLEELGAEVHVGELRLIREYIAKNHKEPGHRWYHIHQIEYMFFCTLKTPVDMSKAEGDEEQTGYKWISFADFESANIYPRILRSVFDDKGEITSPVYLGDVN